jgi:hypothetical protein
LGSEDVLARRCGRPRETGRRLVRIGVEALGGCIIERLELVILAGGKAIVVFLCTCKTRRQLSCASGINKRAAGTTEKKPKTLDI